MPKSIVCIYYDYGYTAPKDFGAYCTLKYELEKLANNKCKKCENYVPKTNNFDDWFVDDVTIIIVKCK